MAAELLLADSAVSAAKFEAELDAWQQNAETYRQRGWVLLGREGLNVEVAFVGRLPLADQALPVVPACIRVNFDNYDVIAPSVTFIDVFTRAPTVPPARALTWEEGVEHNVLINAHPDTGLPFLCLPGVREYHSHHEHSGDAWLLHRAQGAGRLAVICEHIWQRMVRNVIAYRCEAQAVPVPGGHSANVGIALIQGDVDAMQAQMLEQQMVQQAMQQQALAQQQAMAQQQAQPAPQGPIPESPPGDVQQAS